MLGDPSTFVWEVPIAPNAFRVEEGVEVEGRSGAALVWREGPARSYLPLAGMESLYRRLAAVEPTPESVLGFVRQYGRLGEGVEAFGRLPDGSHATVEPLQEWRRTAAWFGEAIRLWDLAQAGNRAELAKVIRWDGKEVRFRAGRDFMLRLFGFLPPPDVLEMVNAANVITMPGLGSAAFDEGDVIEPARCFVLRIVNGYLARAAQPALLWDQTRRAPKVLLRFYPRSLLGVVALQFATAILSGRTTRMCPVCGRYFEVTASASRNDRLTCSNRCRVRAYRDRQAKARERHAAGWTAKRIARELGSELSAVKKWLSQGKE
jgi:hypothetical protein